MIHLASRFDQLRLAFMLLTRLPMGRLSDPVPPLQAVGWAYPVVGLLCGFVLWGFWFACAALGLPSVMSAILSLMGIALLTGALHFDALADCADGLGGGRDRDHRLDIMRDSRLGSYGALALVLIVALWLAAGSALASQPPFWELLTIGAGSRFAMLVLQIVLPAARKDGLGHMAGRPGALQAVFGGLICAFPLIFLAVPFWVILIPILVVTGLVYWRTKVLLGGQTGDILGAAQILSETAALCAVWGFVQSGV